MGYSIGLVIKGTGDEPFTAHYSSGSSEFTDDDKLLADELNHRGHLVTGVPWDHPEVDWSDFDLVLVRSTWDFLFRKDEFRNWLDKMESDQVRLFNPPPVIRGNINKKYLFWLRDSGIKIIPTVLVPQLDEASIPQIAAKEGWKEVVIKPASFGGAYLAERAAEPNLGSLEAQAAEILKTDDLIVQKFFPEVMTAGEWSFVFFDETFSHAVRKVPRRGEWREQAQYGGAPVADNPPEKLIEQAQLARDVLGANTIFTRVDGIASGEDLFVNEVEMIDARLFFAADPDAAGRCADAIERRIKFLTANSDRAD